MSRKITKSILSRDEISLYKCSEELKNTDLYGNLYEVLSKLNNQKAVTLDELMDLDKNGIAALTYNKKTLTDNIIKEWFAERVSEEDPTKKVRCGLCNTPNKYLYYIRNRKNNCLLNVGSSCITKFPGIEGYVEQKQQLTQIHKGHMVIARRNEFYDKFPDAEQFISDANKYFNNLPILLPYNLYMNIKNEINKMRSIFNLYVNDGKKPFKSDKSSIELFQISTEYYKKLKVQADDFVIKNEDNPLICKRKEINWLIKYNKTNLLQQISRDNGIYTINTLKYIYSLDFIEEHSKTIFNKNQSQFFKFEKFLENSIIFSFSKFGYQNRIQFSINLNDFMLNIGAYCIIEPNFRYSDEEILKYASINYSFLNLSTILNYIDEIVYRLNYAFLIDDTTNSLILYRKGDRAIRRFKISSFLHSYAQYILAEDEIIKRYLNLLVNGDSAKWIDIETQAKQGIDEKIGKLYKEYKEIHKYVY